MGMQNGSMHAGIYPQCQVFNTSTSMKNTINTVLPTNKEEL